MAKPKLSIKTPLVPIQWVTVRGQGKLKMNKDDNGDPENYSYTAQAVLTAEQAEAINKIVDKFWRENKPKGIGKRKYEVCKEETVKVLNDDGTPKLDEDDEPIKEATGKYIITASTQVQWPDGKPVVVKLLGSNGKPLPEGHELENGCGEGTMGILHGSLGISAYSGNEGVSMYLQGVQIKDSTFTPFSGGDIEADEIDDDVADTEVVEDGDAPEV